MSSAKRTVPPGSSGSEPVELTHGWAFRQASAAEMALLAEQRMPTEDASAKWFRAAVPGSIFQEFIALGEAEDPASCPIPQPQPWMEEGGWVYRCVFGAPLSWLDAAERTDRRVELVLEQVDCFADVFLNEEYLGRMDNAFRQWRFDVGKQLEDARNELLLFFHSTPKACAALAREHGSLKADGDPLRVYARRPQAAAGWTMMPRVEGVSLGAAPRLELTERVAVRSLAVHPQRITAEEAKVKLEIDLAVLVEGSVTVLWSVDRLEPGTASEALSARQLWESARTYPVKAGNFRFRENVVLPNPALWWPLQFASEAPALYQARVEVRTGGQVIETRRERFGLRQMDLIETDEGTGLRINGQTCFLGGAIWVPPDLFSSRVTDEQAREWVDLAARANLSVLRVWGGGAYERDAFYERCDELGILVWQDFMFLSGEYPDDVKDFWSNVQREATDQIRRLRNHPCIALWCGNDGCPSFAGRDGGSWETLQGAKVFSRLLPALLKELDPARPYLPAAPSVSNGKDWDGSYDAAERWHSPEFFHTAVPHVLGAFGKQSLPGELTLREAARKLPESLDTPEIAARQLHRSGAESLRGLVQAQGGEPKTLEDWIFLSQWTQGEALARSLDAWRAKKPFTTGALIWHFNDAWPGVTCSLVDAKARPKLAYWAVRRALERVRLILTAAREAGTARAVVLHDGPSFAEPIQLTCRLRAMTLDGMVLSQIERPVELPPNGKVELGTIPVWKEAGESFSHVVLVGELRDGRQTLGASLLSLADPPTTQYPEPRLRMMLETLLGGRRAIVRVRSENVVRALEFRVAGLPGAVVRHDNGFDLWPGYEGTVQIDLAPGTPKEALYNTLQFRCLNDALAGRGAHWRPAPVGLDATQKAGAQDDETTVTGLDNDDTQPA